MDKVYVIMFIQRIVDDEFFMDETEVAKRVESLNVSTNSSNYWYKPLYKSQ